jgi:hypothetical protein
MAILMIHGFAPTHHLTGHKCAIHKKPGYHNPEAMHIIHIAEPMENQSLKIGVACKIKQLVKKHNRIFNEFQFGRPNSACISAIILKTISKDSINITKTPAVLHDIDASKAFDLVLNGVSLLALRSLGFPESLTMMIVNIWSGRRCHVKIAYGVSAESDRSTLTELLFGLGQGSTSATDILLFDIYFNCAYA